MQKPTIHKVLILVALTSIMLSNGLFFGLTSGMVKALKKKKDGLNISDGDFLFIVSGSTYMSSIGLVMVFISGKIGRRWPLIISSVAIIIHWVITYNAQNMTHFTISKIISGIGIGARFFLSIMTMSEYTSPKTRAFFLNIITTAAPGLGTLLGHYLGNTYHWRSMALLAIFPTSLGIILPYFCVESPHWFASKGRFQECEEAFRKLHGSNEKSEIELQLLIKVETYKRKQAEKTNLITFRKKLLHALKQKYFWNLMLLTLFMFSFLAACWKLNFSILAPLILEDITGTPNILLYNTLLDVLSVIGSFLSCVLIRKMTMRHVLFSTGYTASAVLLILSACLYFGAGIENLRWVKVMLLGLYFILIESGPSPVLEALMGEIYPLEIKIYCLFIAGSFLCIIMALSSLLFTILSGAIGYSALFLLNASIMIISLTYICLSLPETKGRTLQEIEVYFKTKAFNVEEVLKGEQSDMLIGIVDCTILCRDCKNVLGRTELAHDSVNVKATGTRYYRSKEFKSRSCQSMNG